MDNSQLLVGVALVLVGGLALLRAAKPWLVIVGAILAVIGGWFVIAVLGLDNNPTLRVWLVIAVVLLVGARLLKAPGNATSVFGVILLVIGSIVAFQTEPLNSLQLGNVVGSMLDYAESTWNTVFRPKLSN